MVYYTGSANQTAFHSHPKTFIFEAAGLRFFGCSGFFAKNLTGKNLIHLDLADNVSSHLIDVAGFEPKHVTQWTQNKVVKIDWPDMSTVPLPKMFWVSLILELSDLKDEMKAGLDVVVSCTGSHGRTGTVLAILAALCNQTRTPIQYIREKLCRDCVETEAQIEYIQLITGCDEQVDVPASKLIASRNANKNRGVRYLCGFCGEFFHFPNGTPWMEEYKKNVCDDCYTYYYKLENPIPEENEGPLQDETEK